MGILWLKSYPFFLILYVSQVISRFQALPRFLGTCRHEGHKAIDFHKWKAEPSGMHSHAEHGDEETSVFWGAKRHQYSTLNVRCSTFIFI